jgi:peptide/nickel transport system substrate-binding protein
MIPLSRRALLGGIAASPFVPVVARAARQPDTLRFGLSSFPPNLQPFASTGTAALTVKVQLFRGLLSFGPDGKLRGELAESWQRDGDAGWRFTLRDAVFHNGAKVTSEDVKWTLTEIMSGKSNAYLRGQLAEIQAIETPDARTVRVVMKSPTVTLPLLLGTPFAPIIAKDSLGAEGGPIGAGPYVLASQERGVSLDLVAFDKFYRPGLPRTKTLRMVAYADENARVAALQAGDVDLIEYVPWQVMDQIEKDPNLKLDTVDGPFMALAFNGGNGPFTDARLRLAVAHAIRREEIVKAAFFGRGTPLEGLPIARVSEFYNEAFANGWKYDPAKAKALMAEAGVAGGFSCTLLATAQYGMHKSTAEIVQQHLGEIGIQVTLNLPDWPTRVALGNRGQYEFCVQGQAADSNDPDGLSAYIDGELPPDNARSYKLPTPEIHKLLLAGRGEFDSAKRHAIYDELQKTALQVVPMAGLCWRNQGYAMTRDVQGFSNLPGGLNFYSGYSLENVSFGS